MQPIRRLPFGAGNTTGANTLSQTLATVAGHKYVLSFDAGAWGGGGQAISETAGSTNSRLRDPRRQ